MIIIVHFKKGNGTCVQLYVVQLIVYFANVMVTDVLDPSCKLLKSLA